MWLINTDTLELEEFYGEPPPYAILSHTWTNGQEVSWQEFRDKKKREAKPGFKKIRFTCEQAIKHKLQYAWVDTCCINKDSSAELSEAINSMFGWYQKSRICYVYLADCLKNPREHTFSTSFVRDDIAGSRWFTRGWTLQELVAPSELEFYDQNWDQLGNRANYSSFLPGITGIDQSVFKGAPLKSFGVAQRMSWAANRETTRVEDIAYSLMGVFGVNLPLLYGEGTKAFIRLQQAILEENDDLSIFAWKAKPESEAGYPYRGIFADSPDEFANSGKVVPFAVRSTHIAPVTITNRGVALSYFPGIFAHSPPTKSDDKILVGLDCNLNDKASHTIAIELQLSHEHEGNGRVYRSNPSQLHALLAVPSKVDRETVWVVKSEHATPMDRLVVDTWRDGIYLSSLPAQAELAYIHPEFIKLPHTRELVAQLGRTCEASLILVETKDRLDFRILSRSDKDGIYYTFLGCFIPPEARGLARESPEYRSYLYNRKTVTWMKNVREKAQEFSIRHEDRGAKRSLTRRPLAHGTLKVNRRIASIKGYEMVFLDISYMKS